MSNGKKCDSGGDCTFAAHPPVIICLPGGSACGLAVMAEAEISPFHDQTLADATQQIKQVLASIPPGPEGSHLSFLKTHRGTLLAWAHHRAEAPPDAVPATADEKTLSKALRLKP